MFYSKISRHLLNVRNFEDPGYCHKFIWTFFEDRNEEVFNKKNPHRIRDFIYRPELGIDRMTFYVMSARKPTIYTPDMTDWEIKTKIFDPNLEVGQYIRFKVTVNPTVILNNKRLGILGKTANEIKKNPKLHDKKITIYTKERSINWFIQCSKAHGFTVDARHITAGNFMRVPTTNNGHQWIIESIDISGIIQITNVDLFKAMMKTGIGRQKTFGFGMMMIAPSK